MKIIFLVIPSLFLIVSCNSHSENKVEQDLENVKEEIESIGGNKDEHGCYSSAGYTWSELKNECVQIFEAGQRLNPINVKDGDAIISSFVIMSDDKSKVELHIEEGLFILPKTGEHLYEKGKYKYDYKDCSLFIDGKRMYEIEKK